MGFDLYTNVPTKSCGGQVGDRGADGDNPAGGAFDLDVTSDLICALGKTKRQNDRMTKRQKKKSG